MAKILIRTTSTSQGLQATGMSRNAANLADAGISIAGSFGGGALLRSERVVSALGEAAQGTKSSVSVAYKPGMPGHNMVGVNMGAGTRWSHLTKDSDPATRKFIAEVQEYLAIRLPKDYRIANIPVSSSSANNAIRAVSDKIGARTAYALGRNDCSTYANSILREAGIFTLPVSTPQLTYMLTKMQTPEAIQLMRATVLPMASAGTNSVIVGEAGLRK